ncbi:unnamed protein product [Adineta steineri]|uniref:Uncharacterized protein n=1 Tax=Adineta steineri TaxID=433720 RepID=A0A814RMW5_9BILA|nr:unnamed protein product [Adineta steineri]
MHNWAVVVNFSTSVLQTAKRLSKWCIVIVVENRPNNIKVTENIFFLNATIQNELAKISPFYKASLLYAKQHHIVHKNLGYLWAILHGAIMIWDFDNDNELIVNESTFSTSLNETMEALTVPNHNSTLFNPYPFFVSNPKKLWPRGYPSQSISDSSKQIISTQTLRGLWPTKNIGIIHSLTECQVDVDSVYKSVVPGFPLRFQKISNDRNKDVKLIAPRRTFSPYNKQSTLHLRPSLWALLLPVTVSQQVSDIYRSYVMQRLMWDVGLQTAFAGSYSIKKHVDHNEHQLEKEFSWKIDKVIEYLTQWSSAETSFIKRVKQLFIDLYEYGYIELIDVHLIQLWLEELHLIGYTFPEIPLKYTLIVRTFAGHLDRMNTWYIPTVNMFVDRNAIDVLFVLDDESREDHILGDCLKEHNYSVKYEASPAFTKTKGNLYGYDRQQWSTFYMDYLSNSDYIGVIDSDAMLFTFMHPFYSIFASDDDKRIMLKPMTGDHYHEDRLALQFNNTLDFMYTNLMPMWYRWETFQNLRNYISLAWNGSSFDDAFIEFSKNQRYSQFNILSTYASLFESNYYRIIMNSDTRGAVSVGSNRGREADIRIGCCRSFHIGCNDTSLPELNKDHLLRYDNTEFAAINATEKNDAYYAYVHEYLKQMPSYIVSNMKKSCELYLSRRRNRICL